MKNLRQNRLLLFSSTLVALLLLVLVGFDYRATREELLSLLRDHAHALSGTVAAAARSNRASSALVDSRQGEHLLDQARSLGALDAQGRLTEGALAELARKNPSLRVGVFDADGTRVGDPTSEPGHRGFGRGLRGGGMVVRKILEEGQTEFVTDAHTPRWGGGDRMAAGVRRPRGGAIVVTADASEFLEKPASLEALLADIASGSPEIAYMLVEQGSERMAFGEVPVVAAGPPEETERILDVAGRPAIEFVSDLPLPGGDPARLRIGLRLDGLRRVERGMAVRLLASLAAAAGLVALAFGLAGLSRRFGVLTEKHARAEAALRRRDRLAAMGELASTVAHEVRNPLNAVAMTAQRLRREFLGGVVEDADRAELEDLLGVMAQETQRIDRIVQQFLDYARPPKLIVERVNLSGLVADTVERTRALAAARGVALDLVPDGVVEAFVDPNQLRQALDNLLRNAIDATPEGGRVTMAVRREGAGAFVEVKDTGRGIEPEELPRIFDLYFTTKSDGTGVGLAVTQQIVAGHGGTIEVDSRPGAGTTMTVRLPDGKGTKSA